MYYYIDESGNTGLNLFDIEQPYFYYGMISSPYDLSFVLSEQYNEIKDILQIPRTSDLHGKKIKSKRFNKIINNLIYITKQWQVSFDIYYLQKSELPIFVFFDFIFDSDINFNVPYFAYRTKIKEILLLKMSSYFSDNLLQDFWYKVICEKDETLMSQQLSLICAILLDKIIQSPKNDLNILLMNGLLWAYKNPNEFFVNLNNTAACENMTNIFTPNSILFSKLVLNMRLQSRNNIHTHITVDRGKFQEFQSMISMYFNQMNGFKNFNNQSYSFDFNNTPKIQLEYGASQTNLGLQLVDMLIWNYRFLLEKDNQDMCKNKLFKNINFFHSEQILSLANIKNQMLY